jgi:ornithine cyclodeaminase
VIVHDQSDARWVTERDVVDLLDLPAAVEAVADYLLLAAHDEAATMEKTHVAWDGNTLHALGGAAPGDGLVGAKTWAHTHGGAAPLLMLWSSETGRLVAVIEAFALGQLRTASVSAVATRWLAAPDATSMAMIGTGRQALPQVAAVAAVRPLRSVAVFSPTTEHRDRFVERVAAAGLGVEVRSAPSVDDAVAEADIVTTATRATTPILAAPAMRPGTHVNAIGAITPERRELDGDVLERCDLIVADSVPAAERLASELHGVDPTRLVPLSAVVSGAVTRPAGGDLTLFKAMGLGLADLALGAHVLRRATAEGRGRAIPQPERHEPRLLGGSRV